MPSDPVISVRNVSKAYRIWDSPAARLTAPMWETAANILPGAEGLKKRAAKSYRDFWALKDVSFEVGKGEAVGIIGRNGSGKSTLLQIIAGTLQPTEGEVKVNGRVAALLELGSGFNPEFTGRENVHLYGSIRGLTRAEIDARFDAIAAFADIGDFIEQPVKTYSSGMVVRLAFAVCAHVDADILIIDEALGVGDARFQLKCARTIDRFLEKGGTLLFVSHDVNSVRRLCAKASLLEAGKILHTGSPNTVVNLYSKLLANPTGAADISEDIRTLIAGEDSSAMGKRIDSKQSQSEVLSSPIDVVEFAKLQARLAELQGQLEQIALAAKNDPQADAILASEREGFQQASGEYSYGGELGRIVHRSMHGADGAEKNLFTSGEKVEVRLKVEANDAFSAPIYAMTLKSSKGQEIYGTNTFHSNQIAPPIARGESASIVFRFPMNLVAGDYFLSLGWTHWVGEELLVIHRRYDTMKFTVLGIDRSFGIAHLFAKIEVIPGTHTNT